MSANASTAARAATSATSATIQTPPRATTRTSTGTRTAAERTLWRSTGGGPSAPEASRAAGELENGRVERVGAEVRPEDIAGVELRVRRLPDEEVRQSLLAAGPDDEIGIRQARRVERRGDRALVDVLGADATLDESPERIHELGSPGVVEG